MLITTMRLAGFQKFAVAERLKELEQHISPIMGKGVKVTVKALVGTPFLEIIRDMLKNKRDLVLTTASGKGWLKEIIFGSTATHLMRKCPCPVWVIKPTHRKKYGRVMAAVDPDPIDRQRDSLNAKIMELATSLAHMEGSDLHVVHAWRLVGETLLSGRGGMSQREVSALAHKERSQHAGWLTELVEQYAPETPNERVHLLKGHAEKVIPILVKMKKIELLVMGTVCRTGIAGFIMGNTAEGILQQVDCSVLTVKPDGYVTPIKLR